MKQGIKKGNPNWQKGVSANPNGRPQGARSKLTERVLQDTLASWGTEGDAKAYLDELKAKEPATYARVVFSVIPKDVAITVEQTLPANMTGEEWSLMVEIARTIRDNTPAGVSPPAEFLALIADTTRAYFAKSVLSKAEQPSDLLTTKSCS